jgi:hypothetical protein
MGTKLPVGDSTTLSRKISDHTPLLLSVGIKTRGRTNHLLNLRWLVIKGWFLAGFRGLEKRK